MQGMPSSSFVRELAVARALALDAGTVIMAVYATAFEVVEKEAGTGPVTEADQRANDLIVSGLIAAFPGDSIIAEESGRRDETTSNRCWFVDPLDGTSEFAARNGMFAIHIGLAVEGVASMGIVYAPVTQKMYVGVSTGTTTLEVPGVASRLLAAPRVADLRALRLVVSRAHRSPRTREFAQRLGVVSITEQGSVGLKAGLIAEGAADLYFHPSPKSSRWDTCAPEAILRGAGAELTDLQRTPYSYDGRELENRRGLLAGRPEVLDAVAPLLNELRWRS